MKVLVIGVSERTGGHAMQQLLAPGNYVTALVRKPGAMAPGSKLPTVVQGDTCDAASMERAVMGQKATLVAFGPRTSGQPEALTYAAYQGRRAGIGRWTRSQQINTREDLAAFMVRQLTSNTWVRHSPFAGY